MKRLLLVAAACCAVAACGGEGSPDNMAAEPSRTGADAGTGTVLQAVNSSRFHQLVRVAGMEPALSGVGPYTVLVPADDAFAKLPPEQLQSLQQEANRPQLTRLLTSHMLPGAITVADIRSAIQRGGGKVMLASYGGQMLTATLDGDRVVLSDGNGSRASVTGAERVVSNGVIHQIDTVIAPAS